MSRKKIAETLEEVYDAIGELCHALAKKERRTTQQMRALFRREK